MNARHGPLLVVRIHVMGKGGKCRREIPPLAECLYLPRHYSTYYVVYTGRLSLSRLTERILRSKLWYTFDRASLGCLGELPYILAYKLSRV